MSVNRTNNTRHSYDRVKERFGLSKEAVHKLIKNAYMYGISPSKLEDSPVKTRLLRKEAVRHKRIKIYEGKVFVFCKSSTKCITAYPLETEEERTE